MQHRPIGKGGQHPAMQTIGKTLKSCGRLPIGRGTAVRADHEFHSKATWFTFTTDIAIPVVEVFPMVSRRSLGGHMERSG